MTSDSQQAAKAPEAPKLWAEALGAPKSQSKPAWGGAAPWAAAAGANGAAKPLETQPSRCPLMRPSRRRSKVWTCQPAKEMEKKKEEKEREKLIIKTALKTQREDDLTNAPISTVVAGLPFVRSTVIKQELPLAVMLMALDHFHEEPNDYRK
ncbi:hypothetical protein PR001_g867 [Phytophthora rubi]|uniref:Uncharacterized protein n=1 Tax=Phytophthora rubi TaxID=129364 RepID=A0A6A3PEM0_9STRA|nr:hypothetical protein PR002_g1973 [Phytophthora rubi]KAE9052041.1 hypothetical protein PR001_g867 [Phytophthora rubi]